MGAMTHPGGPEQPEPQQPPTHESGWAPPPGHVPPHEQPTEPTNPYGQQPYVPQPDQYQQPYGGQPYGGYRMPDDPGAQTSLIVGIVALGVGMLCGIGFLGSPVAWVMGARAKRRIDQAQGRLGGRGNAQAGMILGIVGTVLLALALLVMIAVIVFVVVGIANEASFDTYELDGTAA